MVTETFQLFQNAITLAGYVALLVRWSGLAVIGLVAAAVPATLVEMKYSTTAFRLRNWRSPDSRRLNYLEYVVANDQHAKEVKLFGLGPLLLGRYRELSERFYAEDKAHYVFRSSVTRKAIERASIRELEELIACEYPDIDLEARLDEEAADPYQLFRLLLLPLEKVRQSPLHHPEGDVLYHSLQVFELAKEQRPYDEEFLLAALLHDVGKGIDPYDHVAAGLSVPSSASTVPVGPSAPSSVSRSAVAGRWRGSLVRQRSTSGRICPGSRLVSGGRWITR